MADIYLQANAAYLEASCTVDAGTDVITCNGHGLSDGYTVTVFAGTTVMAGLTMGVTYYARDCSTNTLKLAASLGGPAIDITGTGTGTQYLARVTGSGTAVDPFVGKGTGAWQYAMKQAKTAGWGASGNTLHVSNVAAFTEVLPIDLGTDSPSTSGTNQVWIVPWNNGGAVTCATPRATINPAWEINGNDAVASIFKPTTGSYINLVGGKMHSTTGIALNPSFYWTFSDCEIYDANATCILNLYQQCHAWNCLVRDSGGSGVNGIVANYGAIVEGCEVYNCTGDGLSVSGSYAWAIDCVVRAVSGHGVYCNGLVDGGVVGCTIDGNGTASKHGVNVVSATRATIRGNLITNWSGTNARGVAIASGQSVYVLGPNGFYNNTANVSNSGIAILDRTSLDVALSVDPYTNRAGGDFSLASGSDAIGAAQPSQFNGVATNRNLGVFQSAPGGAAPAAAHVCVFAS